MGEGFTGDQGTDTDLVAVDGVNISDKCNSKPLCHKGGNSVFVRGFADEIWCNPVFFEETACVLAKTGMTVVSKHLIVSKISSLQSLFAAQRMTGREDGDSRKVKVDFSLEDMDLSEFKGKATYEQIKAYVLEQTGLKVSSLYIAQIKKKCGLDVGENFNLAKSENTRQPQCTTEKEEAIMQAFRHFGIL